MNSTRNSIPPKIIRDNSDIFASKFFIDVIGVTPPHKGKNYRPVSILSAISIFFGWLVYQLIHDYVESRLSKCSLQKGNSAQCVSRDMWSSVPYVIRN